MTEYSFKPIARARSVFPDKFGIPRQSGLIELFSEVVFEPEYRVPEAFRGIEAYSHLWLIWLFSETARDEWSPTVRPPRLGGNTRMGVFATRSPFRPNPVGLSAVRLVKTEITAGEGLVLTVSGADLMDGTPILDIKPYLAYADAYPEAVGGFSDPRTEERLTVEFPPHLLKMIPEALRGGLIEILEQDPRPGYQASARRLYHLRFDTAEIDFRVEGKTLIVTKVSVPPTRR
ncbi:MAG: tRNA (N6-threonylcarbamoyladenosine(37)-N6)-methyltransferase TrmO [Bacteroides sp.]|nr:tRNA (N6-threonylcarbamoyladenosine(37)-N6)-methyltransferase TrmO [Eubacterium sp.]MCM1417213.1 tRNA (N6-threonylcarbamoyladenosine(37)-N6)-methyltransferase TrmO [Roseburia sp.]MCM1461166.1 tRNA (N6-threonylcarbamoyladenosine(37)-N6)-methyltransferase TrmO [Bacteroides sp.]